MIAASPFTGCHPLHPPLPLAKAFLHFITFQACFNTAGCRCLCFTVSWSDPQVQADVRTIISRDFATRHSLRFPRVERIRYDKSPFDVQTDQELWDLVNQNKGVVGGELL